MSNDDGAVETTIRLKSEDEDEEVPRALRQTYTPRPPPAMALSLPCPVAAGQNENSRDANETNATRSHWSLWSIQRARVFLTITSARLWTRWTVDRDPEAAATKHSHHTLLTAQPRTQPSSSCFLSSRQERGNSFLCQR